MKKLILPLLLVSFVPLSVSLTACTPMKATRGNLLEEYQIKEVVPGVDGKDDVVRKIGSPTAVSTFNDNVWYYMGQRTKKKGIMDPKVVEEKVVTIAFNAEGKVDTIKQLDNGRQDIPVVQRTTPVSGNEFTFLQQMLGNVGKFNRPDEGVIGTSGNR